MIGLRSSCVVRCASALLYLAVPPADGQRVEFDVASVKPSTETGPPLFDLRPVPGGRVSIRRMSLRDIIRIMYPEYARPSQIEGAPPWLGSDRFDIEATFPPGSVPAADPYKPAVPERLKAMLRATLEDRFKLKVHVETREVLTYALVRARDDGRLGPNIARAGIDCTTPGRASLSPGDGNRKCGSEGNTREGLVINGLPLSALVGMIAVSPEIGRPIDDKTGLSGSFDLKLELAASAGNPRPSIFTALQEQLGLKLVAQRGKGEILVIDHAEQPSPN